MRIDFNDSSPAAAPQGNVADSLLNQVLKQKSELLFLEKLLKPEEKDKDKKDEKKGLTKKQVFWIMLIAAMPIGWITSTIVVLSILGMKANVDLLFRNFN